MKDDFSEVIQNASCYALNSENTLYAFRNNARYSYTRVGAKWWLRQTDSYTSVPSSYHCYNFDDISNINSKPEFEPIFGAISLGLVILVYLLWFNIFKRITKWKV